MQKQRSNQETTVQGPGSFAKDIHNNIFELFRGTKVPNLGEDGIFRLSTRLLERHASEVIHRAAFTPHFALKPF